MEQEQTYKQVVTKIEALTQQLADLDESSAKLKSDTLNNIESHFVSLFGALKQRKQQLTRSVEQSFQDTAHNRELEKKELKDKIEATKKILECGKSMYNFQQEIAVTMWETAQEVSHNNTEKRRVQVKLSSSLMDSIHSHGTVESLNNNTTDNTIFSARKRKRSTPDQPLMFKALVVSTLAGSTKGYADGNGTKAKMNQPMGIVFNPVDDCLYVCDFGNDSIRKVTKEGQVSKFVDMPLPHYITFSVKQQCFFVSEVYTRAIKKVTMKGEISTIAGGQEGGDEDGEGKNAMFSFPGGIAVNEETGKVTTLLSSEESHLHPYGIYFDTQQQALFVCDDDDNDDGELKRVSLDGQVSTVCKISCPDSVCALSNNVLLVSSSDPQIFKVSFDENNKVKKEVFAGSKTRGYKDGPPKESHFGCPVGLAIDHATNTCFVAEYDNNKIRAIKYE